MKRTRNNDKDLLIELVKARFKLRYNNSVLGFVWVLMKPMLNFLILYFIFTAFRAGPKDASYAASLFSGLILFYFLQEGVIFGMNSLTDMASIILKINFSRQIAVASALMMAMINFSINFLVIIGIILLTGFVPSFVGILYFFAITLILLTLIYGITLFLSVIFVKVRDLTNVIELFFQILFWASAIFYNIDEMSGRVGDLIRMNPVAILIAAARNGIIHGQITYLNEIIVYAVVAVILVILGNRFFNKNVRKIAEFF